MAESTPEPTTAKEKMRQALDRKNERGHQANEARKNTGSVHGSQINGGGGKRTFRRKSG